MEVNSSLEKWVTLKEIIAYLGIGRETALQWIQKRGMPAYKVGNLWNFKISEVDEWIRSGEADASNGHDNKNQ